VPKLDPAVRAERERTVRSFVADYTSREGYSPTVREIQAALGMSLERTHAIVREMINDGLLIGRPDRPRTIRVVGAVLPEKGEVL
jgi:SOS-response transcriptional repressor LexA